MKEALRAGQGGPTCISWARWRKRLGAPRDEVSEKAPRIISIQIPPDKIGSVIGPGGKQIRELEAYGVTN